ncbi:Aste57867_14510 [Aphanomyces stellatus]|uniref:Aste57867_14510 protein n=1 Tax=Aphanomyces stellatus TaxID=120398 RepID=A0A485L1E9_9STRA|nr:hypothetical protein As57867_014456 [Aphanomyces stellatus]VFT91332.1 Aste57867_14510 [Aphanomyces stellatus]
MVALTQVAVESLKPPPPAPEAVLESMADDALMRLYDYVFPTFVGHFDASLRASIRPDKKCVSVEKFMTPALWLKHRLAAAPAKRPAISCREMWRLWFKGDVAYSNGVPYRRCTRGKGCEMSEGSWSHAKLVMKILVRLDGNSDDALEAMAEETLMVAFDRAFPRYVEQHVGEKYRKSAQPEKSCSSLRKYRQES